jgi:aryl-alcohol dehydrogenase
MAIIVKAAIAHAAGRPFTLEDVELDEPRSDEILVRLVACGICHTDLGMERVWPEIPGNEERYPVVFGHEGAGVVEQVGDGVARVRPGDAVVMSYRSCRACPECAAGHPYYCAQFASLNASGVRPDGSTTMRFDRRPVYGSFFGQSSFATHALAYEDNVVVVGGDVDLSVAAPFGCGVQTGAGTVMNVLDLDQHSSVAVFGAGGVGLSAVMAAHVLGVSTIVVVDPVAGRRQLAAELGATATIDPGDDAVVDAVRDHTSGGATSSIETTAIADVLSQALDCLGARGTCVALGVGMPEFTFAMERLARGRSLRTTIEGDADPHEFIPKLLELHARGRLPVEKLIRAYSFGEFARAIHDAESGDTIKPVLVFD